MKPYQKLAAYGCPTALAVIALMLFSSPWHILVPILLAICMYLIWELDRAIEMPEDYED
jgi:hypothetical protein